MASQGVSPTVLGSAVMRLSPSLPAHLRRRVIHVTARQYRTATPWAYQWRNCVVQHGSRRGRGIAKRQFHVGKVLMPPAIFTGLFLALWCYKCIMLVLFQNAIIYNPFLPPNARSMQISEFARQCGGVEWREERIKSLDGTEIALCISEMSCGKESAGSSKPPKTPVYILYFQGLPPSAIANHQPAESWSRKCFVSSPSTARHFWCPAPAQGSDRGTGSLHHGMSQLQRVLDIPRSSF